jgi:hypothetical protein
MTKATTNHQRWASFSLSLAPFFSFGSAVELLLHPPTAFPLLCRMLSRHIFLFFMTDHYFLLRHPIKKPPKKKKKTIDCLPSLSVGSLADHQRTTQRCQID